jgi:DDE domain
MNSPFCHSCPVMPRLRAWFPIAPPVTPSLPQRWFSYDVIVTSSALEFAFQVELPRPLRTGSGAGRARCPEHDLALGRVLRPPRSRNAGRPMNVRSVIPGAAMRPTSRCAGDWVYLYRAVDKHGQTVESYLSRTRDISAAKAFFRKGLKRHGEPRVITWMASSPPTPLCAAWA